MLQHRQTTVHVSFPLLLQKNTIKHMKYAYNILFTQVGVCNDIVDIEFLS